MLPNFVRTKQICCAQFPQSSDVQINHSDDREPKQYATVKWTKEAQRIQWSNIIGKQRLTMLIFTFLLTLLLLLVVLLLLLHRSSFQLSTTITTTTIVPIFFCHYYCNFCGFFFRVQWIRPAWKSWNFVQKLKIQKNAVCIEWRTFCFRYIHVLSVYCGYEWLQLFVALFQLYK